MLAGRHRTIYILSILIILLAAIASAGGLFIRDLYRDDILIKTAWLGNDIITLAVIVPIFIVVLLFVAKGSQKAELIWMGLLSYIFYNYIFYLFGAAFNEFFLLYTALFALSLYSLFIGLYSIDVSSISRKFSIKAPRRLITGYLLLTILPLAIVEGGQCINFILAGKLPDAPPLIFALDLSIVVPITFIAAVLLWNQNAWGYVLSIIMLVKGFTYGLVLCTGTILISFRDAGVKDPLLPFCLLVMIGGLSGVIWLINNFDTAVQKLEQRS